MVVPVIEDLEDDYPEYVEEELGYQWDAWDVVTTAQMRRHDAILAGARDGLQVGELNDLERWAWARAARRAGDDAGFLAAALAILRAPTDHVAIDYRDVTVAAAIASAKAGSHGEAFELLEGGLQRWPEDQDLLRCRALVRISEGKSSPQDVVAEMLEGHADAPEMLFELAEDLREGHPRESLRIIDSLERTLADDSSTRVDIALLRADLVEPTAGD